MCLKNKMGTNINIIDIIKKEVDKRVKQEVYEIEKRMVKELHDRIPEITAKLAVDIALEPQLMEMGNIIRFEIKN